MALELEVVFFIPAASHSAAKHLSTSSWSWFEEANRTRSCAKCEDKILWFPNQTTSGPWLHLDILSIKIINRTSYKVQPCQRPTWTGNRFDLLLAMWTKRLLRWYRDRTAINRGLGPSTPPPPFFFYKEVPTPRPLPTPRSLAWQSPPQSAQPLLPQWTAWHPNYRECWLSSASPS